MAAYNEERFLAEAVESVLAQSFADFELIITDDGSTDATPRIASSYADREPERVRVIRAEQNRGKPFALNRALAVRRGELIAWLDGDDVMLPDKLARQVLFCSKIIVQRTAVALARGEHDVAHADAVEAPMREQPARRQLQQIPGACIHD